ncbi:MAG: hypothetical protein RI945_184 [Candidatus Parcubacteria bacterium]
MKKIKTVKIIGIIATLTIVYSISNALAGIVNCTTVGAGACTATGIASESTLSRVKSSLAKGGNIDKKLANSLKETKSIKTNTDQDLKNFDLTQAASQASGEAISKISDVITKSLGLVQDDLNNVFTNGAQIVTNLKDFLNKNSTNAIRNVIYDQSQSSNVYTQNALKTIVEDIRSSTDIVVLRLPRVAQQEICNSEKLKDVIKKGEPETYIKAKPKVENVDIDKLCNINMSKSDTESLRAQASFIGLAKARYAGQETRIALADPENTPSGVQSSIYEKIQEKTTEAKDYATNIFQNNGGVVGNLVCLDEKGQPKKFDPTDPKKSFCNNLASTVSESAAKIKADLEAARQAPYLNIVAQAENTTEGCGDSSTVGKATGIAKGVGGIIGGKTETTINNTSKKVNSAACSVGKYTNILNSILSVGGTSIKDLLSSGKENEYAQLASSLDEILDADIKIQGVASEAEEDTYESSMSEYISNIDNALYRYEEVREINIERLNSEVYTYILMQKGGIAGNDDLYNQIRSSLLALQTVTQTGPLFIDLTSQNQRDIISNLENEYKSISQLRTLAGTLKEDIRKLIKQIALDNYRGQQLEGVKIKIQTATDTTSLIGEIESILGVSITEKDVENAKYYWEYIPEYQEESTDSLGLLLSTDQITNFSTKNNLLSIRISAYKLATRKNVSTLENYTPNLPINYSYSVDVDDVRDYSEIKFCNKIANNICTN